MRTPSKVNRIEYITDCTTMTINQWDRLMEGTTKANGSKIRKIIKEHLPLVYDKLALDFYNPYESQCVKKPGLLVYVHSGIEYFIKYS
jgi:hypothetical protein